MGVINLYNTISNEHKVFNGTGRIKNLLPELDFRQCLILKAGNRLTEDYEVQPDDVLYCRVVPGAISSTAMAVIAITSAVVAAGVAIGTLIYSNIQSEKAKEQMEKAQRNANNLAQQTQTLPFLKGAKNKNAIGTNIQTVIGTMKNTPYLLTDGFYSVSGDKGEKQYWNVILGLGYKDQLIKDLAIGTVKARTFSDTEAQNGVYAFDPNSSFYDDNNIIEICNGQGFSLQPFKRKVVSFYDGSEIKHDFGQDAQPIIKQLASNTKKVEVTIQFNGLRKYNSSSSTWDARKAIVRAYWSNNDGTDWHEFFFNFPGESEWTDMETEEIDEALDNGSLLVQTAGNNTKVYSLVSDIKLTGIDGVTSYVTKTDTFIEFVTPASWSIEAQKYSGTGENTNTVTLNTNRQIRFTATHEFTYAESFGKDLLIKVEKETPALESNSNESCYLLYYNSFCFDPKTSNADDGLVDATPLNEWFTEKTCCIGLRICANESTESNLDEINCLTSGVARTWNALTSQWSETKTPTRNPAAWLLELLTSDNHLHSKFTDNDIDLASFGALYEYCETNEYYSDNIITQATKKRDIMSGILSTVNSDMIINPEGKLSIVTDKKEDTPVALLNAQCIRSITVAKSLERKPQGVKVTYTNRNEWAVDTFYAMIDGGERKPEDIITELSFDYVTTYAHAYKLAQRKQREIVLQPREITATVGKEGDYYPLYSTVLLQLEQMKIGLCSSIITKRYVEDGEIVGISINDEVEFETGKTYGVIIQATSSVYGRQLYYKAVTGTGKTRDLIFVEPIDMSSEIIPRVEDSLSFGELDDGEFEKVTNVMKITGIEGKDDTGITLKLKDYNEALYEYGTIPAYKTNLTSRPNANAASTPDVEIANITRSLEDRIQDNETGSNIENPSVPSELSAVAEENRIVLSCKLTNSGIQNALKAFEWQVRKTVSGEWEDVTGSEYIFDRAVDGYPEYTDLANWSFRARTLSIYNKRSDWVNTTVNTSSYGVWQPLTPIIYPRVSDRTITLMLSQPARNDNRKVYGTLMHNVQIKKVGVDDQYFKPNESADPFAAENGYKIAGDTGSVKCFSSYAQTMQLTGQETDEIQDTPYSFSIVATNESGKTSAAATVTVSALCTNIRDVVKARADFKELYITELSALSANVGLISDGGFGNFLGYNFWALSDLPQSETGVSGGVKRGSFRVGDETYFIEVSFDDNNHAQVRISTDNFIITAESTEFTKELVVSSGLNALDQTRITPTGTFYEHRDNVNSQWYIIDKMDTSGVIAPSYTADKAIKIGNFTQKQSRILGHDIGRPYLSGAAKVWHFDDDEYSQAGIADGLVLDGTRALKSAQDSNGIDFTPAILAVAPYCTVAKCLYGQFSAALTLAAMSTCTVDFWMQYLYAEAQTLFEIGTINDKISLEILPAEIVAVVSGSASWKNGNTYIWTSTRNPAVGDWYYNSEAEANAGGTGAGTITAKTVDESYATVTLTVTNKTGTFTFQTGMPDFNWELYAPEEVWGETSAIANRANNKHCILQHKGQTQTDRRDLSEVGVSFEEYKWYHIGIVFTSSEIRFLLDDGEPFADDRIYRYASTSADCTVSLNPSKESFILDELYTDTAEEFASDFYTQTEKRKPWGALSDTTDYFIFDAKEPQNVKSNILDYFKTQLLASQEFADAVSSVIQ